MAAPGVRHVWRSRFKWICLGSLGTGIVLTGVSSLLSPARTDSASDLFLMLDGLLAFAELSSFTLVGLAGIGWIVSPRPQPDAAH